MDPLYIYRIIHHSNLEYILRTGRVVCPNHANADPVYRNIGNNAIINLRNQKVIQGLPPRTFRDYVAFYFGMRSIMLFNIHTGRGEVEQIDQDEIIYLVYDVSSIVDHAYEFFFTDGNGAKIPQTQVFLNLDDLDKVDYTAAYATRWSTADQINDPDLKRKKHSEFHIYQELNFDHISEIAVNSETRKVEIERLLKDYNTPKSVRVERTFYF